MRKLLNSVMRLHWLAIAGIAYWVMLGLQLLVVPHDFSSFGTAAPYFAATTLMLVFGPYLFVVELCDSWVGGSAWWLLKMLPIYLVHLGLAYVFIARFTRDWRNAKKWRRILTGAAAVVSAMGIWYEVPSVGHVEWEANVASRVRLAVVSDLHSCQYGKDAQSLIGAVNAEWPDAVVMVGDIFDDRLPDGNARAFVSAMAKEFPCLYVSGNHEWWSERIGEMKRWLRKAGVTVLQGERDVWTLNGNAIEFCGVDDPTYLYDEWDRQLAAVEQGGRTEAKVRILLSHRPERFEDYKAGNFDLVLTGHSHGGQWLIPLVGRGCAAPDQGFFPKYVDGEYMFSWHTGMLVCRGLARESSPFPRFFNHPELLIVDLVPAGRRHETEDCRIVKNTPLTDGQ